VNDISNAEMAVQLTSVQSQLYLLLHLTRDVLLPVLRFPS